ncbi:MAG: ATP-dependent Clp protease adaptor ClpS [Bacteroidetes bacterium]|nr:ATP-dependent Clp protease adaptor ClpS [Bacteroidota bacterium]
MVKKHPRLKPDQTGKELESGNNELVLYNDEVNTFEYVIETLVDVCGHDELQAEQCALLTHFKGQCTVKTGQVDDLKPMYSSLSDRGLSAEIV